MGDMLISLWSILANFGMDTGTLANKIGNIIAEDEDGNITGTLAPIAELPLIGDVILIFAQIGDAAGQAVPTTIA